MINEKLLTPVQNAQENPRLEFRDGQCMFRMVSQAGTTIERLISWESVRWGNGRLGEWAVAFIPPGRHHLEITSGTPGESETIERIIAPLPGMVIFTIALKAFVWAVKTDTLNPQHEVYRAPLPNIYPANIEVGAERCLAGEVCWGLLKPEQASPRTILKTWDLFIRSTFNNHAASGRSKRHREDVRMLLKELATADAAARQEIERHTTVLSHTTSGRSVQSLDFTDLLLQEALARDGTVRYPVDDLVRPVEPAGVTLDRCIREFFETGEMPE